MSETFRLIVTKYILQLKFEFWFFKLNQHVFFRADTDY